MSEVKIYKTSEKVLIWMKRNNKTQEQVASELGITRQTFAKRLNENFLSAGDLMTLKRMGFEG